MSLAHVMTLAIALLFCALVGAEAAGAWALSNALIGALLATIVWRVAAGWQGL